MLDNDQEVMSPNFQLKYQPSYHPDLLDDPDYIKPVPLNMEQRKGKYWKAWSDCNIDFQTGK
jgi:hypothetical protein